MFTILMYLYNQSNNIILVIPVLVKVLSLSLFVPPIVFEWFLILLSVNVYLFLALPDLELLLFY